MEYGCIGHPICHSFSSEIHTFLGESSYKLADIAPEDLEQFLHKKDFLGINVTIPYKQAVLPYLDEIDPIAEAVGAVNTIVRRGDRLIGYNTDVAGMQALLSDIGVPLKGKTIAVLGTGGTAHTARYVVRLAGGIPLTVSRTPGKGDETYETLGAIREKISFILNTTPCGMSPDLSGTPLAPAAFPCLAGVTDAVYRPLRTRLVQEAKALGIPARNGLYMLAVQAMEAASLFYDRRYPEDTARKIVRELLYRKESIVLTGMPSVGKTTVGRTLSMMLGRPFYDTDRMIEKQTGRSVSDIFRRDGEAAFRALEKSIIERLSPLNGVIIATGGGSVLDPENMRLLAQNGCRVLLTAPLSRLSPSSDRPLSTDTESLKRLAKERSELYRRSCDIVCETRETPEETAKTILTMLYPERHPI